jgi:hypothetical protein
LAIIISTIYPPKFQTIVWCHNEYRYLFSDVTRVKLSHVRKALKYILWDTRAQRIISVAEYRQQMNQAHYAELRAVNAVWRSMPSVASSA